jgi:hypothetical protein
VIKFICFEKLTKYILIVVTMFSLQHPRAASLLVINENRKLVDEFKERSGWNVEPSTDAFKAVLLEVDDSLVEAPPISAIFEEDEEIDGDDLSSDNKFELVIESV